MWSELSLSLSALECPKRKPVGLFSLKRDKRNVDFSLRVLQRASRNVNLDGMGGTVWHKYWGCLIFVRHFPQKLFTKYFHKRTVYFVKSFVRFHKRTVYFVKSFRKCLSLSATGTPKPCGVSFRFRFRLWSAESEKPVGLFSLKRDKERLIFRFEFCKGLPEMSI